MRTLIVSSIPSFYKEKAFNDISKVKDLKVFYTYNSKINRDKNFYAKLLKSNCYIKNDNLIINIIRLFIMIRKSDDVIVSGWDDKYYWIVRFLTPKEKLKIIVESSIFEYKKSLVSDKLKKYFISGVSLCIVSGQPHLRLVRLLGYKGEICVSNGVGIFDFPYEPFTQEETLNITNFLYIGRLTEAKGIDLLLNFFKTNKSFNLNIIGSIDESKYSRLNDISTNIRYYGYKKRDEMKGVFEKNHVLILCSKIEPWGLVVEEALYHGIPVLVSDNVGCSEDVVQKYKVGEIFETDNLKSFSDKVKLISNIENYRILKRNIGNYPFKSISKNYIECYL